MGREKREEGRKEKHAGRGRPLKFKTAEDLQKRIDEYFAWAEDKGLPLSIERLAVFLDVDRKTVYNYSDKEDFFPTIKKAREYIYAFQVEQGMLGKLHPAFTIFLMKNQGYSDRQEHDLSGTIKILPPDFLIEKEDDY